MISMSVKVRGELVQKRFQDFTGETVKVGRRQLRTVMDRIKRRMQAYPAEPPGQSIKESHPVLGTVYRPAPRRYVRTGLLGQSWMISETKDKKGYSISNDASRRGHPYAVYVVGDAFGNRQAKVHEGRWQRMKDVAEDEIGKLPEMVRREVYTAARRKGFGTK